jgi:enediyne biosynthesis protein E4
VTLADATDRAGPYFRQKHMGRGLAVGDLDDDGRPDLVISHTNERLAVLRNVSADGHHWLGVGLTGRPGRDAVGARLTLEVGGRTLMRVVKGGGSDLSASDRRVLFGLGATTAIGRLTVRWPSGRTDTYDGLPIDRSSYLTEGDPTPRPAAAP